MKIWTDFSFVLSQSTRLTDRQTEFSSLDRVCIPCSAVKTRDSSRPTTLEWTTSAWRYIMVTALRTLDWRMEQNSPIWRSEQKVQIKATVVRSCSRVGQGKMSATMHCHLSVTNVGCASSTGGSPRDLHVSLFHCCACTAYNGCLTWYNVVLTPRIHSTV